MQMDLQIVTDILIWIVRSMETSTLLRLLQDMVALNRI